MRGYQWVAHDKSSSVLANNQPLDPWHVWHLALRRLLRASLYGGAGARGPLHRLGTLGIAFIGEIRGYVEQEQGWTSDNLGPKPVDHH